MPSRIAVIGPAELINRSVAKMVYDGPLPIALIIGWIAAVAAAPTGPEYTIRAASATANLPGLSGAVCE